MAAATAKQAKADAERAAVRYEKSLKERAENVRHLMIDKRLRDEDEIANERREGSSMSKGNRRRAAERARSGARMLPVPRMVLFDTGSRTGRMLDQRECIAR